jgi:hypothetical protein
VHQPSLAPVDGIDHPGAARIDDAGAPGGLVKLTKNEIWRANESRLHALHDGVTGQFRADRLADDGARAVAADQIMATEAANGVGLKIAQGRTCGIVLDPDVFDRSPTDDADARLRGRMLKQDWLKEDLVDAVRRLRRRPIAIRAILPREAIAAARNKNARQFLPSKRRAVADVVRIVGGQPGIAYFFRNAEPTEDFHAASRDVIAFRLGRCARGARLDERDVDASPRQIDREREPDRPRANDQHIALVHVRHLRAWRLPVSILFF